MNFRPNPTDSRTVSRPQRSVDPVLHASIVARRIAIIALMMLLVVPMLWSLVTGQRALRVDGAPQEGMIALIAPNAGAPRIGDTVAVPATSPTMVSLGRVADIQEEKVALRDAFRPTNWTAPVTTLSGSVLAVFDGPVAHFLARTPPFMMNSVLIILIIALVAIPLRRSEPLEDETMATVPPARHIKHFNDFTRA